MPPGWGEWKTVGSSVVGTSHLRIALPCQDAHRCALLPDGTLLIAVADGAGSASRSTEGSTLAVQSSLDFLTVHLAEKIPEQDWEWDDLLRQTLDQARRTLEAHAGSESLREFATTLLLAVVTEQTLATLQVGDGALVCRHNEGALRVLTPVTDSEYINVTSFITGSTFQQDALCTVLPAAEIDALAVFTDGLQYVAISYPQNVAHEPFFRPLFAFAGQAEGDASELEALLNSARINDRTDDDKTLVLAVRHATP